MTIIDVIHEKLLYQLSSIQDRLNFSTWNKNEYPQFASIKGLGRTSLISCSLGMLWGIHFVLSILFSLACYGFLPIPDAIVSFLLGAKAIPRIHLLLQWNVYMVSLCTFHLAEFFVNLIYNPTVATSDSFLVNHSTAYTAATIASVVEFWFRFCFCPGVNSSSLAFLGFVLTLLSQALRTGAMVTAGESFNHYIQITRKENHVLVTRGVYRYIRHPSYTGFYFWSISTQLLLGNYSLFLAFSIVSWNFFKRRIDYEEESLCKLFPDEYPKYVATSYLGIPFIWTNVKYNKSE